MYREFDELVDKRTYSSSLLDAYAELLALRAAVTKAEEHHLKAFDSEGPDSHAGAKIITILGRLRRKITGHQSRH